jgi:hypothetical protein
MAIYYYLKEPENSLSKQKPTVDNTPREGYKNAYNVARTSTLIPCFLPICLWGVGYWGQQMHDVSARKRINEESTIAR